MDLYSSGDKMNERIKQLALQADWRFSDKITGDELQPILDKRLEKFAELIVGECLDHIDTMERIAHASNASIPDDYDKYTYLKTLDVLKSLIKGQFGVEE